jgi:ATP-dependent Clp protease ATP-binding subunit ClpA
MDDLLARLTHLEGKLIADAPQFEYEAREIVAGLKRHAAGLADPARPFGVYLLVGATESILLPVVLAKHLYGQLPAYFDMTRYRDANIIHLFVKHLRDLVSQKVLLLGDIDQAHSAVCSVLINLFHTARLPDSKSNEFTDSIIIMTTTVTGDLLTSREMFKNSVCHQKIMDAIYKVFDRDFIDPLDMMFPIFK